MEIRKEHYGQYEEDYPGRTVKIRLNGLSIWFSYDTIVAFKDGAGELVVSENVYGPTTGKHLNWIDRGDSDRLDRNEFENRLEQTMNEKLRDMLKQAI